MKVLNYLAIAFIAVMMIFGGYNHFANPDFYNSFIPDFLPKLAVNYLSAVVEIVIGILVIIPRTRKIGALSFIALMFAFFPIHIWDLTKEVPAIGSREIATLRIFIQFVLIGIGYFVFKKTKLAKLN